MKLWGVAEREIRAIRPEARVGPYRIDRMLGLGGMARVFRAEHVQTSQVVALKTMAKVESIGLEGFYHEIAALQQLSHPGVVPIYEFGAEQGEPWYTMPLLTGPTLRDLLTPPDEVPAPISSQTRPILRHSMPEELAVESVTPRASPVVSPTERQLLEVCAGLLETLNYVHSRGIVHGDIKPENIFTTGVTPILVDFGVALSFDQLSERLVVSPRTLGSVAYMAPERIRGELVDARADLYAVGCILYECLVGVHPFARDTAEGTLLAHLNAVPRRLTDIAPGVPHALSSVVDRLLSKSPANRPGYAYDVLDTLLRHGGLEQRRRQVSPASYLYRSNLVGREQECEELFDRLEDLCAGKGARIVIKGAPGAGKTRLLLEFVDMAEATGVATFKAEALSPDEQRLARPLSCVLPLLLALRDFVAASPGESRAERDTLETVLALASSEELPRSVSRTPLLEALTAILARFSASRPILLAADPLEACDALTVELLKRLGAADLDRVPVLLIFSAANPDAVLSSHHELDVPPLDEWAVQAAIESALSIELAPRHLVQHAFDASGGNPLILVQYLRSLIEAKVLQRSSLHGWHVDWNREKELQALARISTLDAWFNHRLAQLTDLEQNVARAAAALGDRFEVPLLEQVSGVARDEVLRVLGNLRRMSLLHLDGSGSCRFAHREVRQILLARTEASDRERSDAAVVRVLEQSALEDPERACVLAGHLSSKGDHASAAQRYELAAAQLRNADRHWDVFNTLQCAAEELAAAPVKERPPGAWLRVHECLGDAAMMVRQLDEADSAYNVALEATGPNPLDIARLHRKLAGARERQSQIALTHLQQAEAVLAATPDVAPRMFEWLQSRLDAMFVHYWKQETNELLSIAKTIEVEVDRSGTPSQRAAFHFNLAAGYMQQQRYVTGMREQALVEKALELYQSLGDGPRVAMCRFLRSMLFLCSGRLEEAEAGFSQLLSMGESSASVTVQLRALTYLCLVHRKRRSSERVRKLAAAALSLATEHSMPEYRGTALANMAWLSLCDGEMLDCKRLGAEAQVAWKTSNIRYSFYWTALLPLLAAHLHDGDWDVSGLVDLAERLLDVTQELPPPSLLRKLEALRGARASPRTIVGGIASDVIAEARHHSFL